MVILCMGVDMEPFGSLLSLGGDLLGGHLNRKEQRSQQDQNEALQREFAQMGTRWRVADAQAAGVHPLFALGGGGASFTPSPSSANYDEVGRIGQHARQASMDASARELQAKQLEVLSSEVGKNEAQADLFRSEAARNRQSNESSAPFPEMHTDQVEYKKAFDDPKQVFNPLSRAIVRKVSPEFADDVRGGPEERMLVDHDPSISNPTGAATPFFQRFDMGHGTVFLPSIGSQGNVMESLEGLHETAIWASVVAENKRRGTLGALMATYDAIGKADPKKVKEYGKRWGYGSGRVGPGGGYVR